MGRSIFIYISKLVTLHLSEMRILVYGIPLIPLLISLLPIIYIFERMERKYFFLAIFGAHIIDQIVTGHDYILMLSYELIKSLFIWLFGAI